MFRLLTAIALALSTLAVSAMPGAGVSAPISHELARGNPLAVVVMVLLGVLLLCMSVHCWRVRWRWLSWWSAALIPLLALIAFTEPHSSFHLRTFVALLVGGIAWMICYAEVNGERPVTVLVGLLLLAGLTFTFILGICSIVIDVADISPLGMFQKGFLLVFALLGMRTPAIRLS
jgi:hypothetical protein